MSNPVHMALCMMRDGEDFEAAERLLNDLSSADALETPEGSPYSIGGVLAHAHYWQTTFLRWAKGEEFEPEDTDWPEVTSATFPLFRDGFLRQLDEAVNMAEAGTGDAKQLLRIAIHGGYHLGQIATLRQMLGLWPVQGGFDTWDSHDPETDEA